jgi:predicted secreted protein
MLIVENDVLRTIAAEKNKGVHEMEEQTVQVMRAKSDGRRTKPVATLQSRSVSERNSFHYRSKLSDCLTRARYLRGGSTGNFHT